MAKPVTDDERAEIVTLIESGKSARAIAKQVERSTSTISAIAKEIGWTFGQTNAAQAREARSNYCAQARADAANKAQDRLMEILENFDAPRPYLAIGKGGEPHVVMIGPDARAVRDLASAVHTLQKTVLDIDRHDNRAEEGLAAVDQWLRGLVGDEAAA
jgi:hypothetical protein